MKYYPAFKREKNLMHALTQMNLESNMLNETKQRKKANMI
jgi:hypothetical protein